MKHAFLIGLALYALTPFLWLAGIALRPVSETYTTPMPLLPRTLTFENFDYVWRRVPDLILIYRNSIVITGVTVVSVIILTSLAGYAFARLKFPGRNIIFWTVLVTMFMPQTLNIPALYQLISGLNLLDTWPGLFLPYTAYFLPLNLFLMRSAFESIPKDLEDAAIIDGCSNWRLFWQVMMPLAASSTVTVGIFTFVPVWGEFLFAFTFTSTLEAMPLGVGIKLLQPGPASGEWTFPVGASAALLAFIPAIIIYIGFQRWFTKGLLEGALKF
ncbi:MAG: carbohydrate ABC transporter permease [Chloroflexi bacterium]|nr:carbohydrate ABC transporter permease [Chloroflexota bacterium]